MDRQYILFDLDGTITDSQVGIKEGVRLALADAGLQVKEGDSLLEFIGPPLSYSFHEYYGLEGDQVSRAIEVYREYYNAEGIWKNTLYDGIELLLAHLKEAGKTLLVATSKPEVMAKKILEKHGIIKYFDYVCGASIDVKGRNAKADVVAYALECCGSPDKSQVIMIGDRLYDVNGAAACGIETIGVTYGFGSKEELDEAGAICTARNTEQLEHILLDKKSQLTTLCYIEQDGKYLMMHRIKKKNDINKERWIGVGGHFEVNESPDDCLLREVKEETGLTLTDYRMRGIVTFISDDYHTEYMHLYTASGFQGQLLTDCIEGDLEWVDKKAVYDLPLWEGDKVFFRLLEERQDFFSLKLVYLEGELVEVVLDGKKMK